MVYQIWTRGRKSHGLIGDAIAIEASVGDVDMHLKALRSFREAPVESFRKPFELLRALGKSLPTGYLITIDEAQRLDTSPARDYAIQLLQCLAENPAQGNRRYGNSWLILAGLGDTVNMLHRFGITRVDTIFSLGALGEAEAKEVLTERLGEATLSNLTASEHETVVNCWIPRLANEYRHWPHHLEGAAVALNHIVTEATIDHDGFIEIRRIANNHRDQLYGQIYGSVMELNFRAWPAAPALASYASRHNNNIPRDICEKCMAIALQSDDYRELQDAIHQLCHTGLLQANQTIVGIPVIEDYRFPVPSFCNSLIDHKPLSPEYHELVHGNTSNV